MKYKFTDTNRESKYFSKCIGKTVSLKNDDGETVEVVIEELAHSFKYHDRAVVNGEYFINYFELFNQIDGEEELSDDEYKMLMEEFKSLNEDQKRHVLGLDNKLSKFLKKQGE